MKLSEIIREYRTTNNLSMQKFADQCGLSKGYISMLESEFKPNNTKKKIIPSIQAIKKLSVGMGIDFDQLLSSIDGDVSLIDNENKILLNDNELNLLEIYREVDNEGKNMIDTVAKIEYDRFKNKKI